VQAGIYALTVAVDVVDVDGPRDVLIGFPRLMSIERGPPPDDIRSCKRHHSDPNVNTEYPPNNLTHRYDISADCTVTTM